MLCGPKFPVGKLKLSIIGQAFSNVFGTQELLDKVLNHLCYTDRASLFQTCAEVAVATSNFQTVWFVNDENLGDAEFRDEEFKHIVEAGEMWDVKSPRGAKVSMHPHQTWKYQSIPKPGQLETDVSLIDSPDHDVCRRVPVFDRIQALFVIHEDRLRHASTSARY